MILYLCQAQHTNLLDFTGCYDTDSTAPIKKMVGNYILKQFIVHDMRNFSHFTEVVLDRLAFGDSDGEFAEAIEEFLTMYNARITVICEGLTQNAPLFRALLESGVGNIVCDTEITAIQREITECLSESGMTRYHPKERTQKANGIKQYRFTCKNTHIAVISSQSRMGATTTAMGLCSWLAAVGAEVCYLDESATMTLPILAQSYEMEQREHGWFLEGVHYSDKMQSCDFNFIVHDIGNNLKDKAGILETAQLCLMVCGTKPYELSATMSLLRYLKTTDGYVLCPFVSEPMRGDYTDVLQNDFHKVLYLDYQPDLIGDMSNAKHFKTILASYIAGEQTRQTDMTEDCAN